MHAQQCPDQARVGAARCRPLWEGTGTEKLESRVEYMLGPMVHGSRSTKMEAGAEAGASQVGRALPPPPPPVGAGASALCRVDRSCYRGVVTTLQFSRHCPAYSTVGKLEAQRSGAACSRLGAGPAWGSSTGACRTLQTRSTRAAGLWVRVASAPGAKSILRSEATSAG